MDDDGLVVSNEHICRRAARLLMADCALNTFRVDHHGGSSIFQSSDGQSPPPRHYIRRAGGPSHHGPYIRRGALSLPARISLITPC